MDGHVLRSTRLRSPTRWALAVAGGLPSARVARVARGSARVCGIALLWHVALHVALYVALGPLEAPLVWRQVTGSTRKPACFLELGLVLHLPLFWNLWLLAFPGRVVVKP